MIGKRPSYETLASLNGHVAGLIGAINADPELRVGVASSEDRTQAMQRLLRHDRALSGASYDSASAGDTAADEAKLLTRSEVTALVDELQLDNVTPLLPSRPLRTMLEHEAVLGWQFLTGVKVPLPLFKALAPCKDK